MIAHLVDYAIERFHGTLSTRGQNFRKWRFTLERQLAHVQRERTDKRDPNAPVLFGRVILYLIDILAHQGIVLFASFTTIQGFELQSVIIAFVSALGLAVLLAVIDHQSPQTSEKRQAQYKRWQEFGFGVICFEEIQANVPFTATLFVATTLIVGIGTI